MPCFISSKYIYVHRQTHRVLTSVTMLIILGFLCRQQRTPVIAGMLLLDFFSLSTITVHTPAQYQGCCHNMHVLGFTGALC